MNLFKVIKTWLDDFILVIKEFFGIKQYKKYKLSYSIDGNLRTVYSEEHSLFLNIRSGCEIFEIIEGKEVRIGFLNKKAFIYLYMEIIKDFVWNFLQFSNRHNIKTMDNDAKIEIYKFFLMITKSIQEAEELTDNKCKLDISTKLLEELNHKHNIYNMRYHGFGKDLDLPDHPLIFALSLLEIIAGSLTYEKILKQDGLGIYMNLCNLCLNVDGYYSINRIRTMRKHSELILDFIKSGKNLFMV